MNKTLYLFLILFISLSLFSCEANDNSPIYYDNIDYEKIDYEQFDYDSIDDMILFHQKMDTEIQDLELIIDDLIEMEVYSFEVIITEDFQDNMFDYLPSELYDYDINWNEVLTKYAIGTSVIFFTGVMSLVTSPNTLIAYIFATSFKEAVKEALIGAAMGAAINVAIQSFSTGDYSKQAITKYAIEGSADGFMWGAITGALLGAYKGSKTYDIHNAAVRVLKQSGRYTKTNGIFTIKGNEVFIKNQLIGYIDDSGNVIGKGIYKNISLEGQKLFSVNTSNQIGNYNFRAIEKGIKFDRNGVLQGINYYKNPLPLGNGANEIGSILDDSQKVISKIIRGKDASGITRDFVMSVDGRVATILSKGGLETIDDWTNLIGSLANQGVKNAKIAVIEGVKSGEITSRNLKDFVGISDDLRNKYSYQTLWEYIKTNGKFPTDFNWIGHHINNLANYPWLADDINNILIVDSMQHKIIHNFDYRNSTYGPLTSLKQILLIN